MTKQNDINCKNRLNSLSAKHLNKLFYDVNCKIRKSYKVRPRVDINTFESWVFIRSAIADAYHAVKYN